MLHHAAAAAMKVRFLLGWKRRKARLAWQNYWNNRRCSKNEKRFLIIRHHKSGPRTFDLLLKWVDRHVPEIRGRFELQSLPCTKLDLSRHSACVFWLGDPVQDWSETAYRQAKELAARCRVEGIPIVNDVEKFTNATKCLGAKLIGGVGFRTPVTKEITDIPRFRRDLSGMELPVLIREDWGHTRPTFRVDSMEDLQHVPIETLHRPIVVEFIDVLSADGLYRKCRYFAAGPRGVTHHLQVKDDWLTKGKGQVMRDDIRAEEIDYLCCPDPHHDMFQRAREALGLDTVAFDYGYTPSGETIIWEANPFPLIHFPFAANRQHRRPAIDRTFAAIVKLYCELANIDSPPMLDQLLAYEEADCPQ
jgi:hypothetical protein